MHQKIEIENEEIVVLNESEKMNFLMIYYLKFMEKICISLIALRMESRK